MFPSNGMNLQSGMVLTAVQDFDAQCYVDLNMTSLDFPVKVLRGMTVVYCGASPFSDFALRLTTESREKFGGVFFSGHAWLLGAPTDCYLLEVKHANPTSLLKVNK